jgi:hypothetical protein
MFCLDSEVGDILIIRGVLFISSNIHFPCLYFENVCVFGLKYVACDDCLAYYPDAYGDFDFVLIIVYYFVLL